MTVIWLFWQIRISYCKFLMPKPLKCGILGTGTRIQSKDIHNYILGMVRILMKQTLCALCMLLLFFSIQITEHWSHLSLNIPWKASILIHCIMCGWQQNLKEVKVPQLHRFLPEPSNTVSTYYLNTLKKIWLIGGGKSQIKNHNKIFTDHVFIIFLIILNSHFFKAKRSLETNFLEWNSS